MRNSDLSIPKVSTLAPQGENWRQYEPKSSILGVRGAKGGYELELSPDEIKISYIISAVDEEIKMLNCKKESKKGCNNKSSKCITHNLWDQLDQHINNFFKKVKLQDLVKNNDTLNK